MVALLWRFLVATAMVFTVTLAVTEEELNKLKKGMEECREEFKVSMEDTTTAHETGDTTLFDPCYIACKFKNMGLDGFIIINDAGFYDTEQNFLDQDAVRIEEIMTTCSVVNDEEVTDGNKGCERAKMLFTCLVKEKAVFAAF